MTASVDSALLTAAGGDFFGAEPAGCCRPTNGSPTSEASPARSKPTRRARPTSTSVLPLQLARPATGFKSTQAKASSRSSGCITPPAVLRQDLAAKRDRTLRPLIQRTPRATRQRDRPGRGQQMRMTCVVLHDTRQPRSTVTTRACRVPARRLNPRSDQVRSVRCEDQVPLVPPTRAPNRRPRARPPRGILTSQG
jgi:hypothetical protein